MLTLLCDNRLLASFLDTKIKAYRTPRRPLLRNRHLIDPPSLPPIRQLTCESFLIDNGPKSASLQKFS